MPSVTVRGLSADLLRDLRAAARARRRSLNAQVLACLEEARRWERLRGDPDELLGALDRHVARTARHRHSDSVRLIRRMRGAR